MIDSWSQSTLTSIWVEPWCEWVYECTHKICTDKLHCSVHHQQVCSAYYCKALNLAMSTCMSNSIQSISTNNPSIQVNNSGVVSSYILCGLFPHLKYFIVHCIELVNNVHNNIYRRYFLLSGSLQFGRMCWLSFLRDFESWLQLLHTSIFMKLSEENACTSWCTQYVDVSYHIELDRQWVCHNRTGMKSMLNLPSKPSGDSGLCCSLGNAVCFWGTSMSWHYLYISRALQDKEFNSPLHSLPATFVGQASCWSTSCVSSSISIVVTWELPGMIVAWVPFSLPFMMFTCYMYRLKDKESSSLSDSLLAVSLGVASWRIAPCVSALVIIRVLNWLAITYTYMYIQSNGVL